MFDGRPMAIFLMIVMAGFYAVLGLRLKESDSMTSMICFGAAGFQILKLALSQATIKSEFFAYFILFILLAGEIACAGVNLLAVFKAKE